MESNLQLQTSQAGVVHCGSFHCLEARWDSERKKIFFFFLANWGLVCEGKNVSVCWADVLTLGLSEKKLSLTTFYFHCRDCICVEICVYLNMRVCSCPDSKLGGFRGFFQVNKWRSCEWKDWISLKSWSKILGRKYCSDLRNGLHGLPVVCGWKYPPCVRICAIIRAQAAGGCLGCAALYVHAGLHACGSCVPHVHMPGLCGTSRTHLLAFPLPKLAFLKAEPRTTVFHPPF